MSSGRVRIRSFLLGGALGVALAYLLDPDRGRGRRKVARDRGLALLRHGEKRVARQVHRAAAQARGLSHRAGHALRPASQAPVDDVTLVDRVESTILRDPAVPKGRFNVNAESGVVFLRGEIDTAEEIEAIVRATRRVPGVQDVQSLLHLPGMPAPHP